MVGQGRKPEKLLMAWDILRRKAEMVPGIGTKRVEYPLKVLISSDISAPGPLLTRLEKAKYIEKHNNGTRELVWIAMLKMTDLGEDILGSKVSRPEPVRQEEVETDDAKENFSQENASGDVVVVCDYENLRYSLEEGGVGLDFEKLIASARQYGNVVRSIAFMPVHTSADIQTQLRMSGFRIEVCPPRKLNGPDTCDQAIEEFVRFCLKRISIGTFVLVSGDGDFIDTVDEIKNNGRKCVLFHYNYNDTSKVLLSRVDGAMNLASITRPKERVAAHASKPEPSREEEVGRIVLESKLASRKADEGRYSTMIKILQDNTAAVDKTDVFWSFLKAIVSCLKDLGLDSEDPRRRKSFPELKAAVWQEVQGKFNRLGVTSDSDCHGALRALVKRSVIRTMSQDEAPHTYYVFDRDHPLVAAILESR